MLVCSVHSGVLCEGEGVRNLGLVPHLRLVHRTVLIVVSCTCTAQDDLTGAVSETYFKTALSKFMTFFLYL